MSEADRYSSQLRLLGKKVFQLREAVAGNFFDFDDPNSWTFFLKSVLYVTSSLRQVQAGLPTEAAMVRRNFQVFLFLVGCHPRGQNLAES